MKDYTLVVTDSMTWGNGHSLVEAMFHAFQHCTSSRKPTKIRIFEYRAEHKGDVFVDQMGALVVMDGAEITSETAWRSTDPRLWQAYEVFEAEVEEFEHA